MSALQTSERKRERVGGWEGGREGAEGERATERGIEGEEGERKGEVSEGDWKGVQIDRE